MNKNLFIWLLVLMSISLVGIILIQSYFIYKNYEQNEKQFILNVNYVLDETIRDVEKKEFKKYVTRFRNLIDSEVIIDTISINNLIFIEDDPEKRETIIYKNGVIEENLLINNKNYKDNILDFASQNDILLKRISSQREENIFSNRNLENDISAKEFLMKVGKISKSKEVLFESAYYDLAKRNPIQNRIGDISKFENLLKLNFNKMNIDLDFEYAILHKNKITNIRSDNFDDNDNNFSQPIFSTENNASEYSLNLSFPERSPFLLSSLLPVIITSLIFISIIVIAYVTTIFLLLRQRKISQIKSDFINNMTHEFKTPIATINLALSAIKNPKTIENKKKVNKYLKMIDDENNRMNDQVENVLTISSLEKNQLNIERKKLDLNEIIDLAISHVLLIVENKNGKIKRTDKLFNSNIFGNETHLINVFVNILDNAIKYNNNAPQINIFTENRNDKIYIEIKDNGIGMSKSVKSKIFEKFYRKPTGDLHNVKGHGLGLSYVKKIIEFHDGKISVDSKLNTGSSFIIELNNL